MKNNLSVLLFLTFIFSYSQEIFVNENKFLTLIFESNIESGIVSSDDFFFEYNQNSSDNIALLKANKKTTKTTSLVVRTTNGTLFNLNVSYGSNKKNIIKIFDSIGVNTNIINNEIIFSEDKINDNDVISTENVNSIKEDDYTIGNIIINDKIPFETDCQECLILIKKRKNIKRIYDEIYNVKIQLNNIFYDNNKLYFIINFNNKSDLDYNLNYIKSYIDTGNDSKSSSNQYLEKYPTNIFNSNRTINGGTNRTFIFIYDQFTIDHNKKFIFEINENNGERNLFLSIPNYLISKPSKTKL